MAAYSRFILVPFSVAGLFLAGCKDAKIISYRVAKESGSRASAAAPAVSANDLQPDARGLPAPAQAAEGALPPGHPSTAGMPPSGDAGAEQALVWRAPARWAPGRASAMRRGSYSVVGPEGVGDISITAFRGDVGGNLANVNRWRDQLQLPPVPDLAGALEPLEVDGLRMLVFEGANQGVRMIGVIVPRSGATWFFKFTGPDPLVAREKPAFLDFLKTVKAP